MKICPKCGIKYAGDWDECPYCGEPQPQGGEGAGNDAGKNQKKSGTYNAHTNTSANNTNNYNYNYDYGNGGQGHQQGSYQGGKRELAFYEKTWFIVICTILFWPLGLGLIGVRVFKNSLYNANPEKAHNSVTMKGTGMFVVGVICAIVGVITLLAGITGNSTSMLYSGVLGGVLTAAGAFMLFKTTSRNKKYALYEAFIDNRGNTQISAIASKLGQPVDKVRVSLQKMLNSGFLAEPKNGIGAYINGEHDLLVVTHNGRPIVPVEKTMEKEIAAKKQKEKLAKEKAAAEAERAKREGPLTPEQRLMYAISDAVPQIKDEETLGRLKNIYSSMESIGDLLETYPNAAQKSDIKNLRNKYIPSTIDLIDRYTRPSASDDAKSQISGMFDTLATAFGNIESQLRKTDEADIEIDIEVMRKTLERDGVLNSDFDL